MSSNPKSARQPRRRNRPQNRQGEARRRRDPDHVPETFKRPASKPSFFQRLLTAFGIGAKKDTTTRQEKHTEKARRDTARTPARKRSEPKQKRAPEIVEVTSPRLYVGNLSYDTTESDLFELFQGFGSVEAAEIVSHRQTQRSKGFGFVQMLGVADAKRAVEELHDKPFMGRKLVVSGAKSESSR